jgi:hypothetical protein
MSVEVEKIFDHLPKLRERIQDMAKHSVSIGIKNAPDDAYISEFGEPSSNIPATPFLLPGVEDAKNTNINIMKNGAIDIIKGQSSAVLVLEEVGKNTVNYIKRNDNPLTKLVGYDVD